MKYISWLNTVTKVTLVLLAIATSVIVYTSSGLTSVVFTIALAVLSFGIGAAAAAPVTIEAKVDSSILAKALMDAIENASVKPLDQESVGQRLTAIQQSLALIIKHTAAIYNWVTSVK